MIINKRFSGFEARVSDVDNKSILTFASGSKLVGTLSKGSSMKKLIFLMTG